MVKLNQLVSLCKSADLNIHECTILAKETDEKLNISKLILEQNGKTYFRVEQNGEVATCCEILKSWQPWPNVTVYAFTPDDLHIYEVETREQGIPVTYCHLDDDVITPGLSCSFNGQTLTYEGKEFVTSIAAILDALGRKVQ